MLIDTHCHLTDSVYNGAEDVISALNGDGISRAITVGYDIASSEQAAVLASGNEAVYFTAGVHPSETGKVPPDYLARLEKLTTLPKCVAVGEIGLDYFYDDTDAETQKKVLCEQFELVSQAKLPVVFHIRDAYGDMLALVKENLTNLPARGVVHCFSGSKETALEYVKMGFYISFTGAITFKNAVKFPEIISALPRERVMVETDCPYLTPVPYRGKTNSPKYVSLVAEKVAEIWGVPREEVERITTENAYRCFGKLK